MNKQQLSVNDLWAKKCKGENVKELLASLSAEELVALQNEIHSKLAKTREDIFTAKKLERKAQAENDFDEATRGFPKR